MFKNSFYCKNREKLCELLTDSLIVIPSHALVQKSADEAFAFRQDSNFLYFTGVQEPDLLLVIDSTKKSSKILLPERSDYQIEWDGAIDLNEIIQISGVNEVGYQSELQGILKDAKKRKLNIYYPIPYDERVEPYGFFANPARRNLEKILQECGVKKGDMFDVRKHVAKLRMVKQPEEIAAVQRAIDITGETMAVVKENLAKYSSEKDVERQLAAGFYMNGADGAAFESIVASGKNAATIHYRKNDSFLNKNDLLLLDIGASNMGYAADISRVWSIAGAPTPRQKELWEACLEVQNFAFSELKAGVLLHDFQQNVEIFAQKVFKEHDAISMIGKKFPHGISHFLGLDTHDAGIYDEPLVKDCIITVEPGIYLPEEGIGVRVEDDVLITNTGIEILSSSISKTL